MTETSRSFASPGRLITNDAARTQSFNAAARIQGEDPQQLTVFANNTMCWAVSYMR